MRIVCLDQARHGGWAIFNYEDKTLISYGCWDFKSKNTSYSQEICNIKRTVAKLIDDNNISAVFVEDIHMGMSVSVFKSLAQLQGVLVNSFEEKNLLYGIVTPSQWQSYCKAKGRTSKEVKSKVYTSEESFQKFKKKRTKA